MWNFDALHIALFIAGIVLAVVNIVLVDLYVRKEKKNATV
jgi:hypothetical protein